MLSCSGHRKIPEWAIAEISIVENTSTIKINPKEKDDQQMPVREPRKKEENATRPPLPRFTRETTVQKVPTANYAWNSRNPEKVALAYTTDSLWRNQAEVPNGRAEIVQFLKRKWVIAPLKTCRSTNRSASIIGHLVALLMDIRS
jgi:Protein of unknown function (DUF1348)